MSINQFGRLRPPLDGHDYHYQMRAMIPQMHAAIAPTPVKRHRHYRLGPLLDQDGPRCVGWSFEQFCEAAPMMTKPGAVTGYYWYDLAQDNDEWPGRNYEGSSVRGMMKGAEKKGVIKSYTWGSSHEESAHWLLYGFGTLIVGSNWYAEMSEVDSKGFMREPASSLSTPIGGHAYLIFWYDEKEDAYWTRNTWGTAFGIPDEHGVPTGVAKIRSSFLINRLVQNEEGELAGPTQVRLVPTAP
jgi:hypothetical protein